MQGPPAVLTVRQKGMSEQWGPRDSVRRRETERRLRGQPSSPACWGGAALCTVERGGGPKGSVRAPGRRRWWLSLQQSWQLDPETGKEVALMGGERGVSLGCRQGAQGGEDQRGLQPKSGKGDKSSSRDKTMSVKDTEGLKRRSPTLCVG